MSESVLLPSGYRMPIVGLGTWKAEAEDVEQAVHWALDMGYRSIDTAYNYGTEEPIGKALKSWMNNGGKREELFITTKLPSYGNRPNDVMKYLKESLKRLDLEYIDLYLIHHPFGFTQPVLSADVALDMTTDHISIWKEMEKAVRQGLVKSIGISNFNCKQIQKLISNSDIRPSNLQIELHAFLQQPELIETCRKHGISVTAYAPLGSPASSAHFKNKYDFESSNIQSCLQHPTVLSIAEKLGKTPAQVLLRFLIQQAIAVIPKSISKERIRENYEALFFSLSEDQMKSLKALDRGSKGRIFDFLFFKGVENHPEYPFPECVAV